MRKAFPLPLGRFSVFALSYFCLSGGGVFSEAFGYSGSVPLAVITFVLVFSYLASALRHYASLDMPRSTKLPLQMLLLIVDCGWVALILGAMVALPRVIDGLSQGQYREAFEPVVQYLEILHSLAQWSSVLLSPFILIRAIGRVSSGHRRGIRVSGRTHHPVRPCGAHLLRKGHTGHGFGFPGP